MEVNGTDFIQNILQVFHPCNLSKRHCDPFLPPGFFWYILLTQRNGELVVGTQGLQSPKSLEHAATPSETDRQWHGMEAKLQNTTVMWKVGNGIEIPVF